MNSKRILFRAAMVADGGTISSAPGAVLVEGNQILASGSPEAVGQPADAVIVDLPKSVIIPALVNAHCHLDLTHLGPRPHTADFMAWVEMVRANRAVRDDEISQSVELGIRLSRVGGTGLLGDIAGAGSLVPIRTMREAGMAGVSFLEVFGLGDRQSAAIARMREASATVSPVDRGVSLGLQPHSPYSCGPEVYAAACRMGLPLSTHLAEALEEIEFVDSASGPIAHMLRRIGVWNEAITGAGIHPVDWVLPHLSKSPWVAAHLNYIEDRHLELLSPARGVQVTVAYCPRASAYFGHPTGGRSPHRYRDMMQCGINVALGTDSIICLDTPDRISVLDDMRFLYRRDATDPRTLLRMATINGAIALGSDPELFTLSPGRSAGLLAIDLPQAVIGNPLHDMLCAHGQPRWVHPKPGEGQ